MKKIFLFLLFPLVGIAQNVLIPSISNKAAARTLKKDTTLHTLTYKSNKLWLVGVKDSSEISFTTNYTVPAARQLTIAAGLGVNVSGGTQDLSENRTWTISLPQSVATTAIPAFAGIVLPNGNVQSQIDGKVSASAVTTLINNAGFITTSTANSTYVKNSGNELILGIKTFSSMPIFTSLSNSGGFAKINNDGSLFGGDLTSGEITSALGFTPYNSSNPSGYISSFTETDPTVKAINGIVKSNGTAISAAVAGTDYLAPNGSAATLTNFPVLNQNTTGTASGITGSITESQVTNLTADLAGKQASLVSGTSIKTVNGTSLLGSGDITIGSTAASSLTGTTLASNVVASSLTSFGVNPAVNNIDEGYTTTATSAGTLTLVNTSNYQQYLTGTTTHTVVLPVVSTLVLGRIYFIKNSSTGIVTVNSSGGNLVQSMAGNGSSLYVTCILTSGTTAASWSVSYSPPATGSGNAVLATSPTITSPVITNIAPAANFTLTQNSVAPFTSVNTGAVANTLYLNAGNVGIGTNTPNAPLQFSNGIASRKIVLFQSTNNDHQVYSLGVNSFVFRYQVESTSANHVFYAGVNSTTSNELMRIQGNGNVGIGTASPAQLLDINGSSIFRNTMYISSQGYLTWAGGIANTLNLISSAGKGLSLGSNDVHDRMYLSTTGSVGIGTTTPAGIFDVNPTITTTTYSYPFPRMTTTQVNALTGMTAGAWVFDTTTGHPKYYNGSAWVQL